MPPAHRLGLGAKRPNRCRKKPKIIHRPRDIGPARQADRFALIGTLGGGKLFGMPFNQICQTMQQGSSLFDRHPGPGRKGRRRRLHRHRHIGCIRIRKTPHNLPSRGVDILQPSSTQSRLHLTVDIIQKIFARLPKREFGTLRCWFIHKK